MPGCGPLIVNYGQAGYYRTLYTPAMLTRLTENFARLRPLDQIGLLADNWALGLAGYQSPAAALDMADAAPADAQQQIVGADRHDPRLGQPHVRRRSGRRRRASPAMPRRG